MKATEFSRHRFPPGGWQFVQSQTGWRLPTPTSSTFDQSVILIIKHRLANPAVMLKHHLSADPTEVGNELEAFTRTRLRIPAVLPPEPMLPKTQPLRAGAQSVGAGVVEEARRAIIGIGVLRDWLGDGMKPVATELAESRAARCADCPQNEDANWIQKLEGAAAEGIRNSLEARRQLSLRTSKDAELKACQVCNCHLQLKVWVPEKYILARTPEDHLAKLREVRTRAGHGCWIVDPPK